MKTPKCTSTYLLTKLLIGQKNLGVFVAKEDQPHVFQLPVGR
jgi:hypothetical protein